MKISTLPVKLTAFFLCVSLGLFQSPGNALYAAEAVWPPAAQPIAGMTIPEAFGKVDEVYSAPGASKTVIYIQDAHDSLEAQENISRMIDHLVEHEGVKTVYEEGYEGPVPTDALFGNMADRELRRKVSYFFMDQLRVGGAEFSHINRRQDFKLLGADSIRKHLANIRWYQKSEGYRKETEEDLNSALAEIRQLALRRFPKPLKQWLDQQEKFEAGQVPFSEHLKNLSALFPAENSQAPLMAGILALGNAPDDDRAAFLKTLDPKALFAEMNRLEKRAVESFLTSHSDRRIFFYGRMLRRMRRLVRMELSQAEYDGARTLLRAFKTGHLAAFLASATGKPVVLSGLWERMIQNAVRFYETAESRDEAASRALDVFVQSSEKTSVLVFGGFHGPKLKAIFRRKGLSYVVVSPKITRLSERHQNYYKELMSSGHYAYEASPVIRLASRPRPLVGLENRRRLVDAVLRLYGRFPDADPVLIRRGFTQDLALRPEMRGNFERTVIQTRMTDSSQVASAPGQVLNLGRFSTATAWVAYDSVSNKYWAWQLDLLLPANLEEAVRSLRANGMDPKKVNLLMVGNSPMTRREWEAQAPQIPYATHLQLTRAMRSEALKFIFEQFGIDDGNRFLRFRDMLVDQSDGSPATRENNIHRVIVDRNTGATVIFRVLGPGEYELADIVMLNSVGSVNLVGSAHFARLLLETVLDSETDEGPLSTEQASGVLDRELASWTNPALAGLFRQTLLPQLTPNPFTEAQLVALITQAEDRMRQIVERPEAREDAAAVAAKLTLAGPIKTIMLLDESVLGRAISEALLKRKFPDIRVLSVSSGRLGLEHADLGKVDLFLTDIQMLNADSMEFIRQIRDRGLHSPVLVYSTAKISPETLSLGNMARVGPFNIWDVIDVLVARSEKRSLEAQKIEYGDRARAYIFDMPANPTYRPDGPVMFAAFNNWVDGIADIENPDVRHALAEKTADAAIRFVDTYTERHGKASVSFISYRTAIEGIETKGHPYAALMQEAREIMMRKRPDILTSGEGTEQLDAALDKTTHGKKVYTGKPGEYVAKRMSEKGFPPKIFIFSNFHSLEINKDALAFYQSMADVAPEPELVQHYLEKLAAMAKAGQKRIVIPESTNPLVLKAVAKYLARGIGRVILLGDPERIKAAAAQEGIDPENSRIKIIDPRPLMDENWKSSVGMYFQLNFKGRARADVTPFDVRGGARTVQKKFIEPLRKQLLEIQNEARRKEAEKLGIEFKPVEEKEVRGAEELYYGAWMVANGDADAMVAGKDRDSQDVIFAMKTLAGFAPGIQTFSAAQLYSTPYRNVGTDGVFMLADITTNQNPDADVLVQIAVNTVKSVRRLVDPKVRLAFVFGKGEGSQKIQQAIAAARAKFDELGIEAEIAGEPLTVDEALRRGYNGLIGPDLDTANPLYKNFQWLGGYTPLSLTTGGAGKIILDLSRGAGADEIEATMEVAAVLAGAGDPERAEQREVSEQAVPVTGPEYVLVINAGSSSVKWKYYRMPSEEVLGKDEIQNIGQFGHPATHEEAFAEIAQKIQVLKLPLPQGIGHRVVLGGDLSDSSEITPEIDALIQKYFKEAPLHNPPNHAGYKAAQRSFPGIPNVAVFDTSFHAFKKLTAWLYPVGRSLAQKLGLRRYGFHGTSYRYIMTILPDMLGKGANEINAIIFHLGNGSSGTRIENGIAVDTTMGLFPNEGVMMGTRSGSLPSPLALFAAQQFKKEQEAKLAPWKNWLRRFFPFLFRIDFEKIMDEVIRFFDKGSGVQGISGLSYDMRKLLAELGLEQTDDPDEIRSAIRRIHEVLSGPRPDADEAAAKRWDCALAIDMYAESVASAIGQYYVKMDRVDVLAFTGGIGSRNGIVRQMILDLLKQIKTRQIVIPTDGDIPSRYARVLEQIRQLEPGVIPVLFPETDEEIMIARDTYRILSKANRQELKSEGEKQRAESRADAVALASQLTLTGPIRTVMVLEDQAGLRAGVVGLIERDFPGLQVIPVADGREGLAHPQLDSVDLFVTDLSMPGMDGWEFIRRIRQAGKQTPIYVYSGSYLDPATRDLGNIAGSMAVQPHLVIKSLLARSEMRDQQLEKTAFDVMKATGWQPNDRVRVILVSDNTGTLTEKTDIPIQGEMLDGLRDFLAHPDNILVVNSGDADTEMNKAHRPFFDGSQALTFEQRSRYHRIAGSGKIRRGYKPENGSIAYQAVLEDWPVSDRLRYARTIMEAFFSELKQRTAQPGNLFARVFEDSGAEGIEAAYQDALRRFHVIEEEGTWGTSDDRYVFELFPGELGRRIGNPYLYDLGSSMCLELQDTFAVLNKIAPGQKDTFQLAFSVEMAMRRQFPGHESLNFSSTPTASALSKITKATAVDQTLREILTVLEPSLAADEKVLILYMGDGRNDIPTFGLNLNTARIASAAFYLNHQPEDAERLPPGTYVTEGERLDGGLQVLQFANAISGKRVADMAPFSARQWKPAERREQRGKAERPKPKEKVQSPNRTEGKASGNFGRAELRDLAPQHGVGNKKTKNAGGIDSVLAIRERVKSLTGRFTVAVDLAEFAALEEAQRLEYETFLVQNKNIALAAYHSGVEVDPAVRSRLEWLQEKLGYDRVVFSPQGPGEIFSKYAQFGKVIHLSMTQNTKLLGDLVDLAQKDSRIYLFRYLGDETGLLTAALLLADAEDPTARGRVVDFSMISSVLRNQITQYLASLSFASAA